ncbi:DUF6489 family protein [Sphingomonas solaris]|uniref:Uncharacterized protein n=1 Tax=Alterirhizorhabdus solaris TaxID=2529389 RepID=A0A558R3F5_9SPHN|nr:DUF6489 family protein [Sphingomonas solaris]TVV73899.1 hypothetical protein FOY91_11115 [Sphingomonas solaris]
MKVTMDVDCTPAEARNLMGLPDLSSIHEIYLDKIRRTVDEGLTPETVETLMRSWSPMGEASMSMWRQLFEQMSGGLTKK